jgi:hypothetical protein
MSSMGNAIAPLVQDNELLANELDALAAELGLQHGRLPTFAQLLHAGRHDLAHVSSPPWILGCSNW